MQWRQGGLEQPGRKDKFPLNLPAGFPLQSISQDESITQLLREGRLDAVMSARAPSCYGDGKTPVARLFENYGDVERDYFRRTRIFPIMHAVGIRRDVDQRNPWLAASLYKAFAQAKQMAQKDLFEVTALKIGLPWIASEADATRALMGDDFWPYGVAANRATLDAMTRYSFDQGLAVRRLAVEELFAATTLEETKV
jgi:4,5-dihydroxyphthalate decarboxylase